MTHLGIIITSIKYNWIVKSVMGIVLTRLGRTPLRSLRQVIIWEKRSGG